METLTLANIYLNLETLILVNHTNMRNIVVIKFRKINIKLKQLKCSKVIVKWLNIKIDS